MLTGVDPNKGSGRGEIDIFINRLRPSVVYVIRLCYSLGVKHNHETVFLDTASVTALDSA